MMHATFVDKHCRTLADTERLQPFGPETVVWRVRGHMFAAYTDEGQGLSLRSNNAKKALRRVDLSQNDLATYLTGGGWVLVPWETPPDVLRARIDESYRLVLRDWPPAVEDSRATE